MVTRPLLRAGFYLLYTGFMVWMAVGSSQSFTRWAWAVLALISLGVTVHFVRIARRQRAS